MNRQDIQKELNASRYMGRNANFSGENLAHAVFDGWDLREASFVGANLERASFRGAHLKGASFERANLEGAVLDGADLNYSNLREADLFAATLREVNLQYACLLRANLEIADLRGANLSMANLRAANLTGTRLHPFQIPQEGPMIVWKRLQCGLAKLKIPAGARRTATPVGRKCRAERAEVIWLEAGLTDLDLHHGLTYYRVGQTVRPDKYDDDIRVECTHGIHFFLTREEAEQYR